MGVFVLEDSVLHAEQITSPSLAWLLPSPYLWKPDEVLVQSDSKNYSLSNLQDFFKYVKSRLRVKYIVIFSYNDRW